MTPAATCRRPPARAAGVTGAGVTAAGVTAAVLAPDAVLRAGVLAVLDGRGGVRVSPRAEDADVLLLVGEVFDEGSVGLLRGAGAGPLSRCVVVADDFRDGELGRAVELGVVAVVPLREATGDRVAAAVRAARDGTADLPPRVRGLLLERLRRRETGPPGTTDRERRVLRLVSEGLDTGEIAGALGCSERTVKYALQAFTARHRLATRAHAVAFALRTGLI